MGRSASIVSLVAVITSVATVGCGGSCDDTAFVYGGDIVLVNAGSIIAQKTTVKLTYCVDTNCWTSNETVHDKAQDPETDSSSIYVRRDSAYIWISPLPPALFDGDTVLVRLDVDGTLFSTRARKIHAYTGKSCEDTTGKYSFSVTFDAGAK